MSRQYNPNINQSVPNVFATGRDVQDNPDTSGTVNVSVLRFLLANNTVSGAGLGITQADSVTLGATVSITQAGIYSATMQFSQAVATNATYGISLNVAAAALLAVEPLLTSAGMLVTNQSVLVAANNPFISLAATFAVTRVAAQAVGGAILRFHGTEPDGTIIPTATIDVNAECAYRVQLVSNIV